MVTLQSLLRDKAFYRDVAQLVAHYVRDVGVGRSSRLFPTSKSGSPSLAVRSFWLLGHLRALVFFTSVQCALRLRCKVHSSFLIGKEIPNS